MYRQKENRSAKQSGGIRLQRLRPVGQLLPPLGTRVSLCLPLGSQLEMNGSEPVIQPRSDDLPGFQDDVAGKRTGVNAQSRGPGKEVECGVASEPISISRLICQRSCAGASRWYLHALSWNRGVFKAVHTCWEAGYCLRRRNLISCNFSLGTPQIQTRFFGPGTKVEGLTASEQCIEGGAHVILLIMIRESRETDYCLRPQARELEWEWDGLGLGSVQQLQRPIEGSKVQQLPGLPKWIRDAEYLATRNEGSQSAPRSLYRDGGSKIIISEIKEGEEASKQGGGGNVLNKSTPHILPSPYSGAQELRYVHRAGPAKVTIGGAECKPGPETDKEKEKGVCFLDQPTPKLGGIRAELGGIGPRIGIHRIYGAGHWEPMSSIDALEMPAAKKLIGTRVDPNLDKKGCCDVVEGKRGRGPEDEWVDEFIYLFTIEGPRPRKPPSPSIAITISISIGSRASRRM
ncbi:hypothetical protein B0H13DRAFT_1886713 [Mycena leptocephala]|nr:hypothetical protein B0H13DRAFT_1886713 [Mycena leptocephala]